MAISTIDLGKIKWIWRGAWQTATPYTADDVVSYAGSTYICVSAHTSAGAFSSDLATRWNIIAEGGTPTTTLGDVIVRGASQDERLGIGSAGQVLTSSSGTVSWETPNLATNVYYVSEDGDDANDGRSLNTPWASIAYACTQMTGPATLYVKSGVYTETLPITVPAFVAVLGDSMRTTTITAAAGSQSSTMWKLGNGAILNKMLFTGLTGFVLAGDNITNATLGGVYVALDSASPITTKSPYVIECSAISSGGIGAIVDGSLHATGNKSIVFHGYTVILDNGAGIWVKDGAKAEIVSCFTYFCHFGYAATGGGKIRSLNGNNSYGTYGAVSRGFNNAEVTLNGALYGTQVAFTSLTGGSFSVGNTVTGVSSSTVATVTNVQNTKVYINITSGTGFTDGETIGNGSGVTATVAVSGASGQKGFVLVVDGLASEPTPGGSIEIAGDAFTYVIQNVSGTYVDNTSVMTIVLAGEKVAASADNATFKIRYDFSQIRLTGHDFLSIGTGGVTTTNYPGVPINPPAQGNEVVESFPGRVFYVSTDQDGNFRVGDYFRVDQATGRATLNANAFDLAGLTSLRLGSIGAQLGELVNEFSSDPTLSGNSNAAVPTEAAVKGYFTQVDQNIVPDTDDTHTLGTSSNRWNHVYVGPGSITLGSLTITDADGALDIKVGADAAGAKINAISNGTSNVSVAANGDITLTAAGVLAATLTNISTTLAGNLIVDGDLTVLGDNFVVETTNYSVTDALIELHNPAGGAALLSDDGSDIGIKFHYYKTSDKSAALVWANDTGALEYYSDATENAGVISGTYGTIKGGGLLLEGPGNLNVAGLAQFEEILVDGNIITTTTSNADLQLGASGTGVVSIPSNNLSIGGDVLFADNSKATFGAGSDLEIYHVSADNTSRIVESGSGNLIIQGTNLRLGNADFSKAYFAADDGGAATIYYNDSPKLATSDTGVTVTGALAATDVNVTTVDTTNIEVTNIKAKDGTAAIAIANTTGAVTISTNTNVTGELSESGSRVSTVGKSIAMAMVFA